MDRNVHSRRETAVLVGIAVHSKIEEIGADAAVVQQSVAFARRAVAADSRALFLAFDQERQQLALGVVNLVRRNLA